MTLLTEDYNLGLHLTLEEFYAHPTLAEQRQKVQPEWQVQKPVSPRLDKFPLQSDTPVNWRSPLISGGSGFFGLHLIDVLLTQNLSCSIVVLSRSDKATLLEKAQALFGPEWVGRYQNNNFVLARPACRFPTRSESGISSACAERSTAASLAHVRRAQRRRGQSLWPPRCLSGRQRREHPQHACPRPANQRPAGACLHAQRQRVVSARRSAETGKLLRNRSRHRAELERKSVR